MEETINETVNEETEGLDEYRDKMYIFLQYSRTCNKLAEFFEKKHAIDDVTYDTSCYDIIAKRLYDFVTTREPMLLQLNTQHIQLIMHRAHSDTDFYQINIINCKDNVLLKAIYVYLDDDNMQAVVDAIEQVYNALEENELYSYPSGIKGLFAAIISPAHK